MPAEAADTPARHASVAARLDIRRAEAGRMLGLLDSAELPERARQWLADGVATTNVRALAASPIDPGADGVRRALLREIAEELDLGFGSQQAARTFQAEEIIGARTFGVDMSAQIYGLANSYTDELVHRFRGFVARLTNR
jgi:hypothetical protein